MSFFNFSRYDNSSHYSSSSTSSWSSWSDNSSYSKRSKSNVSNIFSKFSWNSNSNSNHNSNSHCFFKGFAGCADNTVSRWGNGWGSSWNNGNGWGNNCSKDTNLPEGYRSIDGSGYNEDNPEYGQIGADLIRLADADPTREPGGSTEVTLPSAREVSNAVMAQGDEETSNSKGASDLLWVWGQFLDHDITHSATNSDETVTIEVPEGDEYFDPYGTGEATISMNRSEYTLDEDGNRIQANDITAWIDGSNVYGSDEETANSLRSFEGGKLSMSEDNMLPIDEYSGMYEAGDVRANENIALTSMHTLWAREHNSIATELAAENPDWDDETLYQEARQKVIAEMQVVTYNEYLPMLLGDNAIDRYTGYDSSVSPDISTEFSTAAYRIGHTMLSSELQRLDEDGNVIEAGNIALMDAFFNPTELAATGIDPILSGAATQTSQAIDPMIIDDVRNFLFGQPGQGGFDLASINIERGRDHALSGYNDTREALGLARIESFDDPIFRDGYGEKLAEVYDSVDDIDLWVAGLAEVENGDSMVGETFQSIMVDQFTRIRDADPYWYQRIYDGQELRELECTTLSDIISRNTDVTNLQSNVFVASSYTESTVIVEEAVEENTSSSFSMSMGLFNMDMSFGESSDDNSEDNEEVEPRRRNGLIQLLSAGRLG